MTRRSRTRWIWVLIVQLGIVAPWALGDGATGLHGAALPCASAAHDLSHPCPGCPASACATADCPGACGAGAIVLPAAPPGAARVVTRVRTEPHAFPLLASFLQPPLHPPPIR